MIALRTSSSRQRLHAHPESPEPGLRAPRRTPRGHGTGSATPNSGRCAAVFLQREPLIDSSPRLRQGYVVVPPHLNGLGVAEGQALLADKQLSGTADEWSDLIAQYGGNGLALKVVGESIRQVFGGDLGAFLGESGPGTVFGGIRWLLAGQIERRSALEQDVLRVLTVQREPVTVAVLLAAVGT